MATKELQQRATQTNDRPERTRTQRVFQPATDIYETAEEIVVVADMPGVDEQAIDITLENSELTITGSANAQWPEGHELVDAEFDAGDHGYARTFVLSDQIDRDRIQATMKDGVLRVRLPKAKAAAKKITVKAE